MYVTTITYLVLQAHTHYIVLKAFHEAIQYSSMTTPSNLDVVNALCTLYAAFGVMRYSGDFMMVCDVCVGLKFCTIGKRIEVAVMTENEYRNHLDLLMLGVNLLYYSN